MMKKRKKLELVLGLVGLPCAGKGILSDYLINKHNFGYASFSGVIKEEIEKRRGKVNRDSLQAVGGELREKFGPEILAKRVWKEVVSANFQRVVVDGIRGTEEVEFLKRKPNFYLVVVLADTKIRYQRMISRGRKDEKISWSEFKQMEERDKKAEGRNIDGCLKMADFEIENKGTMKEFQEKIDKILEEIDSFLRSRIPLRGTIN